MKTAMIQRLACIGLLFCGLVAHAATKVEPPKSSIAAHVTRAKVVGIDLVAYPTAVEEVVTLVGSLPAGDSFAALEGNGNVAVPTLVGMMLDRGTQQHDQFTIARELEEAGAAIDFSVDTHMTTIQARFLRRDLPMVIRLLAEQLRTPAFAQAELDKARQQFIGSMQYVSDDTGFRAQNAFNRAVFPAGHPNRQETLETMIDGAKRATVEELKRFHSKYYGPVQLTLVVVGDLDVAQLQSEVGKAFSGWSGGGGVLKSATPAGASAERIETVNIPAKTSLSVLLGHATGIRYNNPDSLPLRLGMSILGSGFTGRLMSSVRDREGLTYNIGAAVVEDTFVDGAWYVSASFAPELLDKGLTATRRELQRWRDGGITAQELANRKESVAGSFQVGLATTGGLAGALLSAIHRGYDAAWLDRYPAAVEALTLEQVNTAIRAHIDPAKLVIVTAGSLSP